MVRLNVGSMKAMAQRFIEIGAEEGVTDMQRESLYTLHTMFRYVCWMLLATSTKALRALVPGGRCSPVQATHFEPSFPELTGTP
jgi:hypothetical protein